MRFALSHLPVHEAAAERRDEDDRRPVLQVDIRRIRRLALHLVVGIVAVLLLLVHGAVGGGAGAEGGGVLLDAAKAHGLVVVVAAERSTR